MPEPHLNPTEVVVAITICLLFGAVVIVAAFNWLDRLFDRSRPDRLEGWWTHQESAGQRWTPTAWARACDLSLERSRARRERNP